MVSQVKQRHTTSYASGVHQSICCHLNLSQSLGCNWFGQLLKASWSISKPRLEKLRNYIWLGNLLVAVVDNTINGSVTSSAVNYVTADQLGTPRVVTNGTGTVIWSFAYQGNPWGEQQPSSSSGYVLNLRYSGQYYDVETGLMYNGARYFDSARGGFDQPDPSGFNGGIDLYVYGFNNPLMYVDPSGLSPPGVPPPMGPFSPEGPPRIPEASDIPSNIPGGPWTPAGPGQLPGDFYGPPQPKGGKTMCRWVPEGDDGTPPYWNTKAPGQDWNRWNSTTGKWQSPEESHPGNPPPVEPPVETPSVAEPPVVEPPVVEPPIIDPIIW